MRLTQYLDLPDDAAAFASAASIMSEIDTPSIWRLGDKPEAMERIRSIIRKAASANSL